MLVWLNSGGRETYLRELMRHEGRQDGGKVCGSCFVAGADPSGTLYKCMDCMGFALCCASCMVTSHTHSPLHIIQVRQFSSSTTETLTLLLTRGLPLVPEMERRFFRACILEGPWPAVSAWTSKR